MAESMTDAELEEYRQFWLTPRTEKARVLATIDADRERLAAAEEYAESLRGGHQDTDVIARQLLAILKAP